MYHKTHWTEDKIKQRLELIDSLVYRQRHPIPPFRYKVIDGPDSDISTQPDSSGWETIEPYSYWAKAKVDFLLHSSFQVPAEWSSDLPVAFFLPLGEAGSFSHPESLIYIDGEPLAACDRHHQEVLLPEKWCDGQPHSLLLHGWTGNNNRQGENARLMMKPCELVQLDQPTRDFSATARVALGIAANLDDDEPAKGKLLNALNAAFQVLDLREPFGDGFYASVAQAKDILYAGLAESGAPRDVTIAAAGHAHIDVAWLWTLAQTRQKSLRTFHTVLHLMEQFPDYKFTQSQPQLYDYVLQDSPELFEAIKAQVAAGRWEPLGGMWVEADCNVSGAEPLARQFLLGRQFFWEHFGKNSDSPVLWLPDVFGYAWALPQLIKKAGLDYFMTIKIGWNQYNRLPYDSFWWRGIDGTRVLTHFSTSPDQGGRFASTYNASATPYEALGAWSNFQQKELHSELLMIFGYGDGGGGPTREMLENIREMGEFPATPQMRHDTVANFFKTIEAQSGDNLPTWNGELYFELHRGTYTTQARNKLGNRKSEFLLHDAEFLAAFATLKTGFDYPADQLTHAWQLNCLNQFHDILPGSSIGEVYVDSLEQYSEIEQVGSQIRGEALSALAGQMGGDVLVANPTSFKRSDLAFWDGKLTTNQHLETDKGQYVLTQQTKNGTWLSPDNLPPYSVTALAIAPGAPTLPDTGLRATTQSLENEYVRVEFDGDGNIVTVYDKKRHRDVLPEGAIANQFQAFEDRPLNWDAWDFDIFFEEKVYFSDPAESIEVIEEGPLCATVEIKRRILSSPYTQRFSLLYNSPQLTIETDIDWQERNILLKVAFPVEILSPQATFEIQWGSVQRPTHRNTSWDWGRFETCAQKWVDLSEGGYGVSLLNDCKYGHDIHDNVMRISLLRGTTHPDPNADYGNHSFTYALLPHSGDWSNKTIAAAYALNDPLLAVSGPGAVTTGRQQLVSVEQDYVIIETIKQAEDGRGVIVRLYESQRERGDVKLEAGFPLKGAILTNLVEEDETALETRGSSVTVPVKPFEIITLRLIPED